jgi:hypothetical protein
MGKEGIINYKGENKSINDFLFSNVDLGIFECELLDRKSTTGLKMLVFSRLDMILELNSKLIAN